MVKTAADGSIAHIEEGVEIDDLLRLRIAGLKAFAEI